MKTIDSPMGELIWSPSEGINVSSRGDSIYKILSPFSHHKSYKIPVPGKEYIRADSVEGIWQGLKLFCGITDESQFSGRASKRKGIPDAFLFGDEQVGYIEARHKIYQPAYIYHLINNALPIVANDLEARLQNGNVLFHDLEKNKDIKNPQKSYSHASLAVEVINLMHKLHLPLKKPEKPNPHPSKFKYLHEHLEFVKDLELKERERELTNDILTFAYLFSSDEHKQIMGLRFIELTGQQTDRIKNYTPTEKTKQPYANCLRR